MATKKIVKSVSKKKNATKKFSKLSLIAGAEAISGPANVDAVFTSGIGQMTASLFRSGLLINMQSISSSGRIVFSGVETNDLISINGICTGNVTITINIQTSPATPQSFTSGPFHVGLIVL